MYGVNIIVHLIILAPYHLIISCTLSSGEADGKRLRVAAADHTALMSVMSLTPASVILRCPQSLSDPQLEDKSSP